MFGSSVELHDCDVVQGVLGMSLRANVGKVAGNRRSLAVMANVLQYWTNTA